MDEEGAIIGALEKLDKCSYISDVRLRDVHRTLRLIRVWASTTPKLEPRYAAASKPLIKANKSKPGADSEEVRERALRNALRPRLPTGTYLERVAVEPLSIVPGAVETMPTDAFLYIWLQKPSKAAKKKAAAIGIPGKKEWSDPMAEGKRVGGRPGYVIRSNTFYTDVWGLWEPHPDFVPLLEYVSSLEPHQFKPPKGADQFADDLKAKGFLSAEGKKFTPRSVRRLNIAYELLRGNKKPEA